MKNLFRVNNIYIKATPIDTASAFTDNFEQFYYNF